MTQTFSLPIKVLYLTFVTRTERDFVLYSVYNLNHHLDQRTVFILEIKSTVYR